MMAKETVSIKKQASGSWAVVVRAGAKESLLGTYANEDLAKVARSLATDGPASAKALKKRISAELDSVYHALFRLQGRQIVRCDRSRRPYVWALVTQGEKGRAYDGMEAQGRED